MDNIIEICKNIKKVLEKHNIKKYDFMIKSFPHSFILTIPVLDMEVHQINHILHMLEKMEDDVSNGYDSFHTEIKASLTYIFFSGMLL